MTPVNGRYMYISHVTLSTNDTLVPLGTTHCVFGSGVTADGYGLLGVKFDGSTLNKLQVPLGQFVRIGSIIPGTTYVLTESNTPATTVTTITFYRWEMEK